MSDTNVHRVVGNLLVGTSHFFVDTTTNQVGINTSSPSAALDVATGDVKVGSGITLGNNGTITATGGFNGDGSGLSGVNSDSGSWVNGSSSNIHLAVSTDNVGIGVLDPSYKLDVDGDINISSTSTLRKGGIPAVFSNWTVHTNASDIYRSSGNVGIGTVSPSSVFNTYGGALWDGSDHTSKVCATLQVGRGSGTGASTQDGGTGAILEFRHHSDYRFVTVESVSEANYSSHMGLRFKTTDTSDGPEERMRIDAHGNVGIGTVDPGKKLHVYGSIQCHNTGSTGDENGLFLQSVGDWYNLSPGNDGYLHLLGGASGQGNMSGNFSSMKLAKLITYSDLDVNGNINISSGNKVRINGDDAVFPRRTLVNGTSYSLTSGSWTKLCDFGHNYLDGAYAIKIEWNYGGTGQYWAGMATGMVPAKSYTHVQYDAAPDEPLSLNHFYHHRTVGRFEFTLDSDNYFSSGPYGRIALWVKGGSTATHQFYVDVRKIL